MAEGNRKASRARVLPAATLGPLARPRQHEPLHVDSERALLAMARVLEKRIAADPEFSPMLIANPVLGLKAYGITLSPAMADHVLRALREPRGLSDRRAELTLLLRQATGEAPRPHDPAWLAALVFRRQCLAPRDTSGQEPAVQPPPFGRAIAALREQRPPRTPRYPQVRSRPQAMRVAAPSPALRRLDMSAPVPALPPAKRAPDRLSLAEAWFYKDDPIVAAAVELGQIQARALPLRSADAFRALARGDRVDVFRAFVQSVRFDTRKPRP